MKATIENNELVIRLPLSKSPQPSKSGKSLTVATTSGIVTTDVQVQGKPVKIGVNAFIER